MTLKYIKPASALLLSAITLATFTHCNSSNAKDEKQANMGSMEKAAPLETIQLKEVNFTMPLKVPGELFANQQVEIYAKVNSFVKDIRVDVGSEVRKGQLLMLLEAPEITSKVAEAKSRLISQQAIFTATKATFGRIIETSKTPGAISNDAIDQITAKKNSDYAQYQAAKATYDEVKAMEGYLELRAPFSGTVTMRTVDLGAYVGPSGKGSEHALITIQEQAKLRLKVSVPETNLPYVIPNQEVNFSVRSMPNKSFSGRIARKAGALDLRLRSELVEIDILNSNKELLPGMVADVIIPLTGEKATIVVPRSALVNSDEGHFVFKVKNNKATKLFVKKGRELDMRVEVFGLASGDTIVSKVSMQIKEGQVVN
jgi:membrane fusion protein, multidrug efflux system